MPDSESVLITALAMSAALAVALGLTIVRPLRELDPGERQRLLRLFLIGVAGQCLHAAEEFGTGFHERYPELWEDPTTWSPVFFVAFNLTWIAIWLLSAAGLLAGGRAARVALVPIWFFALMMTLNGVAHPGMALLAGGYFPGLVTSPVVGVLGACLLARLVRATSS